MIPQRLLLGAPAAGYKPFGRVLGPEGRILRRSFSPADPAALVDADSGLLSPRIFVMPIRCTTLRRDRECSAADEVALLDEDKPGMVVRIRRLNTGLAWAEPADVFLKIEFYC